MSGEDFSDDEARRQWQGIDDIAEALDMAERFAARYAAGPRFEVTWKIDAPGGDRVADLTFVIDEHGTVVTDNVGGGQLPADTWRELNARKRQN